jgi:hypothetical protein
MEGRAMTRVIHVASPVVVFAVLAGATGFVSAFAAPTAHYIYAGQPVTLDVDVSRVAVRFHERLPGAVQQAVLAGAGVPALSTHSLGIERWSLVDLRTPLLDAEDANRQLVRLAALPAVECASPVLLTKDGMFWIPTQDILLRVKPAFAAQAVEIAAQLAPELKVLTRDFGLMPGALQLRNPDGNGFQVLELANRLAADPRVAWAQPDPLVQDRLDHIPNDPFFGDLWGIRNTGQFGGVPDQDMDGDLAWDITTGDPSVVVMVMDVGVQQNHPDLNQIPGMDFTTDQGNGGPVNACDVHGTLVSGCVSAIIDNAVGVAGIAPNCKVASARIGISTIPCDGTFQSQSGWKVSALAWAVSQGFAVTNASFSSQPDNAFTDAYINAREHGITHFASTGNQAQSSINYPASIPEVNAVGALNPSGVRAGFSAPASIFRRPGRASGPRRSTARMRSSTELRSQHRTPPGSPRSSSPWPPRSPQRRSKRACRMAAATSVLPATTRSTAGGS